MDSMPHGNRDEDPPPPPLEEQRQTELVDRFRFTLNTEEHEAEASKCPSGAAGGYRSSKETKTELEKRIAGSFVGKSCTCNLQSCFICACT